MNNLLQWLGSLLNVLGVPGFVHDTDYRSARFGMHVRVRRSRLYTVVSINDTDTYFRRLSGRIDGVGVNRSGPDRPL